MSTTVPTEQENLADTHPEKVAELKDLITAHYADAVEPLYAHKLTSAIMIDKTVNQDATVTDEYVLWEN